MDYLEAAVAFLLGVTMLGFIFVLFNVKFKSFFITAAINLVCFAIYLVCVQFNLIVYTSLTCFTFGAFGVFGFAVPLALIFI